MGFFKRLRNRFAAAIISSLQNPATWFAKWLNGGTESDSGVTLTEENVIGWAPVWYAISRISGHLCTLPLNPMRRLERGAEKDIRHQSYRLVRTRPNDYMTAAQFWETLSAHALLYGNGKAAVVRSGTRLKEILLIHPAKSVTVYVNGEKWHAVKVEDDDRLSAIGGTEGSFKDKDWIKIPDRDVLHVPGLGLDGVTGLCTFEVSPNTYGIGLAAETAVSKDFANGSAPGIILTAPQGMFRKESDAREFMENFYNFHSGLDNRSRAALLREGITATTLDASNKDAQWVEQRTFQRQDVALIFGLESILGDDASVSYGSAEQKDIAYLKNTLAKWLVKIEQECDEKLLTSKQKKQQTHFFKYNTAALLRTDFASTMNALSVGVSSMIISRNEAREKIDMNPVDGGDEFINPNTTKDGRSEPEERESESMTPEEANRAAMAGHLQHMIGVEVKQVMAAASGRGNFISWLDGFYSGKWLRTFSDSIDSLGGDREIAAAYCDRSRNELLEIAGTVTPDGLASAVAEVVEKWPQRADLIASEIIGDLVNA